MYAIYARQSIEKKDSVSIEAQIDRCVSFCDGQDYKIYKDAGYSGKNINRPQFTKLLEDIKKGVVKKVIAYRLDRISRSIADFSQLLLMFDEYNVDFVSATENFDTNTPMGRAMINIVMTFAQLERETIVERVTDNYYFRANNGYWAGGYAPYGYRIKHIIGNDGKKHSILEIDKEQSEVVKRIFDMYINKNMSMRKIAQQLSLEKIPTLKNYEVWRIDSISSILTRPLYTKATTKIYDFFDNKGTHITNDIESFDGTMVANLYGKTKKNSKVKAMRNYDEMYLSLIDCTPFISNDDWLKAQSIKGKRKTMAPRSNTSTRSFLCGLVKCGKCGSNLVIQGCKNRYGIQYYYLICSKKREVGSSVCDNKMIDVSKLQDIVINDMKTYFNSSDITAKIEKYLNTNKEKKNELLIKKEQLENDLIKVDIQIQNLINSIAEGNITISRYINQKVELLETEKQKLSMELTKLNDSEHFDTDTSLIEYVKNINEKLETNDFEELKILCKNVIDKIVVTDENIDIYYKI